MVRRKKPNWVELLDGPCGGTRCIASPDETGCFRVQHFLTHGVEAKVEHHVYRMEPDVWIRRSLKRTARWVRQTEARPRVW